MRQIELYIMGGLGNQLYQYAYARYLQEKYNFSQIIIYTNNFKRFKLRNLELQHFKLNRTIFFTDELKAYDKFVIMFYRFYQRMYRAIKKSFAHLMVINSLDTTYFCTVTEGIKKLQNDKNIFMYGYFVSSKVASEIRPILMNELVLEGQRSDAFCMYINYMEKVKLPVIGVSIRCGTDYEKYSWPICTKDFYISGIQRIFSEVGKCELFIFADDIEKVKKEKWFEEYNVNYIQELSVTESFELLRHCDHYVCSNSSFSWWGGFLSYSSNPLRYYSDSVYSKQFKSEDSKTRLTKVIYLNYITGEESDL